MPKARRKRKHQVEEDLVEGNLEDVPEKPAAYFGLFRVGELVSSNSTSNPTLLTDDCKINLKSISITLKHTKQLPAEAEKTIRPVLAMREYCKTRALSKGPLFCHNNGRAVTRQQVYHRAAIYHFSDIWIVGDSIPYWGGVWARDTGKVNLRTSCELGWYGVRGLGWHGLRRAIETKVLFQSPPRAVFIHLGGNDLNRLPGRHHSMDRYNSTPQVVGCERCESDRTKRTRINRLGRSIAASGGPSDAIACDIKAGDHFFRNDGVHLNDVGIEFYLDYLRDTILKIS
ncbi:hypothetical protein MAR_025698 [Mya arenaria]|uniref:SGNH hydrolase-type esterase domain-containing protein n=1 Tax=Mya arenaria TaxID=6604 RepID=A0ABY7ENE8_MYAAR|nr:hypothetical protein MAR_025698 [Mya arenaria]